MSFYYWRTTFSPDSMEREALRYNNVQTLYIRYFDVDWSPGDTAPGPVAPLRFSSPPSGYTVIPVIYFRNRVFEKADTATILAMAGKVFTMVSDISNAQHLYNASIQFDCDWTERTKDNYFRFLSQYRRISHSIISSTIRLHQLKYPERTGIPPVDYGVLMYYNMGNIDTGNSRSIYERAIAHRYTPSLRVYPLPLDIALPIFSWGLQVRGGKVIRLLDKINTGVFEQDTNFSRLQAGRYTASHPCFRHGYYFQERDEVKLESVRREDLEEIITDVNRHSNHRIRNLIFFDLDRQNLQQYDKDVFKEVLDHTE